MPLSEVMAMYGYKTELPSSLQNQESYGSSSEEDILNNRDLTLDKEEVKMLRCSNVICFSVCNVKPVAQNVSTDDWYVIE